MRVFGCRKFNRLASEQVDRELNATEVSFMEAHRNACPPCRASETTSSLALNMLRGACLDVQVSENFDERVIRRLHVQTGRESIRYWSPAVAGAFVAGLAVVAALQIITRTSEIRHLNIPGAEANRTPSFSRTYPGIESFDELKLR